MNAPAIIEHNPETVPAVATPMAMIDRALASNASPETLERLLALQERWEASQARKAFDEAMANAKAERLAGVRVKRRRTVDWSAFEEGIMSKGAPYTPGPWEIEASEPGPDSVHAGRARDLFVQATYNGDGVTSPSGTFTICQLADGFGLAGTAEETDANARLIAAAPELLEALTGLLAVYDKLLGGMGMPEARTARLLLQRLRLPRVQGEG